MNRPTPRALLVLACVAICAALLGACGDADESAGSASALERTVAATSKIDSARLTASLDIEPDGLVALGGPIRLRVSGPVAAPRAGRLPRAKLAITASLGGRAMNAGATSTGRRLYVRLGERDYVAGAKHTAALRKALGGTAGGGFASLGLDPAAWIEDPKDRGDATVGGVATTRTSGTIDMRKLLADVAQMLDGAGADGLLTARLREQIAGAVKSSKVDVWSGKQDAIMRQLAVVIDFAFDQGSSPMQGLDGGRVKLRLRLDDVNATELNVKSPKDARPLAELFEGGGLSGLLGGFGGATGRNGAGAAGEAFEKCVREAGQDSEALQRCASKLGP